MTNDTRAAFEAWWAHEIDQNGGHNPGADYRHWALMGYLASRRAALEEIEKLKNALEEIAGNDEECRWTADGLSWIAKEALRALGDEGVKP